MEQLPSVSPADESTFRNPDGTLATWLEPVPLANRRRAFAKWFGGGLLLALALWGSQYSNGVLGQDYFLVGLAPLALGALFGVWGYRQVDVRRYSTTRVQYTTKQRLRRAALYWALSIGMFAVIWSIQLGHEQFDGYWGYAWPALIPLVVGTGLYLRRGEVTLTAAATEAKAALEAQDKALAETRQAGPTAFDNFVASPWFRYPCAVALCGVAYYFAAESPSKHSEWLAVAALVFAGICARELSRGLLYLGLVVGFAWLLVSGLAALPVSAAIIIGALIIASAVQK